MSGGEVLELKVYLNISKVQERTPRAGHLLFISKGKATSHYTLYWAIFGGDRRCTVASIAKPIDATGTSIALCNATCPAHSKTNGHEQ
jgi:hypothetical protein